MEKNEGPKTKIQMSMPAEAALRLQKKWKENPEEFKKFCKDNGFGEILDVIVEIPKD